MKQEAAARAPAVAVAVIVHAEPIANSAVRGGDTVDDVMMAADDNNSIMSASTFHRRKAISHLSLSTVMALSMVKNVHKGKI